MPTNINAVVVENSIPEHGVLLDLDDLVRSRVLLLQDRHFEPATALQETGLHIEQFSPNHISGNIYPGKAGILAFAIPYNRGRSLKIDGEDRLMTCANFGPAGRVWFGQQYVIGGKFKQPAPLCLCLP